MLKHDAQRCTGCLSCIVACQQEYNLPAEIRPLEIERFFQKEPRPAFIFKLHACRQCKRPSCREACPEGAFSFRKGIVVFDPGLCSGCGQCVSACSSGSVILDGSRNLIVKCDTCLSRREQGLPAACVQACPVEALWIHAGNE